MQRLLTLLLGKSADLSAEENAAKQARDWRDAAVKKAQKKYNKPFKCGPKTLQREVIVTAQTGGKASQIDVVDGGKDAKKPKANLIDAPFSKRVQA